MHIASLAWIGAAALSASARLEAENKLLETEQRLRRELAETQRQRLALLQAELGAEVHGAADDRAGPNAPETDAQPVPASLAEAGNPFLEAKLGVLMDSGRKLAAAATTMAEQAEPEKTKAKATTEKAAACDEKARRATLSANSAVSKIEAINRAVEHMESEAKSEYETWAARCEAAKKSWWGSSDDECAKKNELQAAYQIEKARHDVSEKALRAAKWTQYRTKQAKKAAEDAQAEARGSEEQVMEQDDRRLKDLANELRALSHSAGAVLEALKGTSPSRGSASGFAQQTRDASGLGAHTVLPGPHPMHPGARNIILQH